MSRNSSPWVVLVVLGSSMTMSFLFVRPAVAHENLSRIIPKNGVFWETKTFLKDAFRDSEQVTYERMPIDSAKGRAAGLAHSKNRSPPVLYLAKSGEQIDGYAYLTDRGALGRFGVIVDPDGQVRRVVVMEFFDRNQADVLDARFLAQFKEASVSNPSLTRIYRPHDAAPASRAIEKAVYRAVGLVKVRLTRQLGKQ